MLVQDIFRYMTLGVLLAFGYTVLTHSSEASTIINSVGTSYNSTLTTLEGR